MARRALRSLAALRIAAAILAGVLAGACKEGSGSTGGGDPGGGGPPPEPFELPAEFESLLDGFRVEKVVGAASMPVKLAAAPDGRIFFNELGGAVRIIDAEGNLQAQPFASLSVVTGGERGLLGLALSPNFARDRHVYVVACVDGPPRQQIIRFTDAAGAGDDPVVIVDDLPMGAIHNSGDIQFLDDGTLLVSVGDVGDEDSSQAEGTLAGRILRYTAGGGIPGSNPISGSPEWCRGLRNTFDLTVHPRSGGVFGVENGPATDDELNYLAAGKNFGWPELPPSVPSSQAGLRLNAWPEVIAPTGIAFHDGEMFGDEFRDDLFILGYVESELLWLKMSGNGHTDLDEIVVFAKLGNLGTANKPLDIIEAEDGSLYFSTFTAIWRVYR
jgi:glucose/arabinose dehydrogenase